MVNEKILNLRVKPYYQEMVFQMFIDVIIIGLIWAIFMIFPDTYVYKRVFYSTTISVFYVLVAIFLHYKIPVLAFIDKRKKDYMSENVRVIGLKSEYSWSGDFLGNSYARFFYPNNLQVDRCVILVINDKGKRKKIRAVMSQKRYQSMVNVFLSNFSVSNCKITYFKRSRILIDVQLIYQLSKSKYTNKQISEIHRLLYIVNVQT